MEARPRRGIFSGCFLVTMFMIGTVILVMVVLHLGIRSRVEGCRARWTYPGGQVVYDDPFNVLDTRDTYERVIETTDSRATVLVWYSDMLTRAIRAARRDNLSVADRPGAFLTEEIPTGTRITLVCP